MFPCSTRQEGMILVSGTLLQSPRLSVFHGLKKVTATIEDDTGKMPVCWYNMPWLSAEMRAGQTLRLYGRLIVKNGRRVLQNPKFATENEGLVPVYKPMKGFPARSFLKLIRSALEKVDDCCPETLPDSFRIRNHLCELNYAIRQAHFPDDENALIIARRRLSFERILLYLVYVTLSGSVKQPGFPFSCSVHDADKYWNTMPFTPTAAQKRVQEDILSDLRKKTAMSRLVQGDVGCGKVF